MAKSNPAPPETPKPKKVTIADLRAQARALLAEADAREAEQHAAENRPTPITSDEGVACLQLSAIELVNIDPRGLNPTRYELHLNGRTYTHCGERAGAWLYRTV